MAPHAPTIRAALATSLALAAVAAGATPAAAHTDLASTTPRAGDVLVSAPATVTATYGQPLGRVEGARVTVDGRRTATGVARLAPDDARRVVIPLRGDAPAGAYRVTWTVAGADGHVLAGELAFRVRPPASVAVLERIGDLVSRAGAAVGAAAGAGGD